MRKGLVVIALLVAGAAGAKFGDVIKHFHAPGTYPTALAWDGQYLWVQCTIGGAGGHYVFRITTGNGSVVSSFPASSSLSHGLAWNGTYLYEGDSYYNNVLAHLMDGSIVSSFGVNAFYGGLTWDGSYLWATTGDPHNNYYFRRLTPGGEEISSFQVSFVPFDAAWDGHYLVCGSGGPTQTLYRLTTAGSIVESCDAPSSFPWACTFDGQHLWVSVTGGVDWIYELDAGNVAVEPASLSAVKALFR